MKANDPGLDLKRFWDLISVSCAPTGEESDWYDGLIVNLACLAPEDILAFDWRFDALTEAAYRNDLWWVASLVNGGASDDGFYYFRCWLVGMGKDVYEAALANPDSLAEVVAFDRIHEAEIYAVAATAYELATNGTSEEFWARREQLPDPPGPPDPDEDQISDVEFARRFPRLARMYRLDETTEP